MPKPIATKVRWLSLSLLSLWEGKHLQLVSRQLPLKEPIILILRPRRIPSQRKSDSTSKNCQAQQLCHYLWANKLESSKFTNSFSNHQNLWTRAVILGFLGSREAKLMSRGWSQLPDIMSTTTTAALTIHVMLLSKPRPISRFLANVIQSRQKLRLRNDTSKSRKKDRVKETKIQPLLRSQITLVRLPCKVLRWACLKTSTCLLLSRMAKKTSAILTNELQ